MDILKRLKQKSEKSTTVQKQEWYKLLVMNGGAVLLFVVMVFKGIAPTPQKAI